MKQKICIVTGQYPPQVGGVGHSAYRIANMLAGEGREVHVVAFQKHPQPLPFDESYTSTREGEVLVHRVKVYRPAESDVPHLSESAILTRYNREMFQALNFFQEQYGYHLLHAFFLYPAAYIAGLVGKMQGVKVVASIRGNDVGKYVFDPIRMPFVRLALQNADYVTSVATSLLHLADRAIIPIAQKSRTILNSLDFSRLRPREKPSLPLRGMVIGTLGLFRYKKGLVYLCKALGSLREELDFTLLLAGDYFKEEDREPHLQYIRENHLEDRTVVTGKIPPERVADYLQLFDIVVFPSLFSEGCPLSMLEAMALGKAVIGSRTGAIPEIIQDHQNGILVSPGSSQEIARAIRELVNNPELRHTLGENARQTVNTMTREREMREWLQVYETVLGE